MMLAKPLRDLVGWAAKILGVFVLALVVTLAIGEGMPNPLRLSPAELLAMAAFIVMLIGILAAWRWEGLGSALILGGFASFWVINFLKTRHVRLTTAFTLFLLLGLLHGFHWWQSKAPESGS